MAGRPNLPDFPGGECIAVVAVGCGKGDKSVTVSPFPQPSSSVLKVLYQLLEGHQTKLQKKTCIIGEGIGKLKYHLILSSTQAHKEGHIMKPRILHLFWIVILICSNPSVPGASANNINDATFFVKPDATGVCTSWDDACDLVDALSLVQSGDQIWVAVGTYYPTDGTDRNLSFSLVSGVAIYGGFEGTETALEQRDWETNSTILSGDIGTPGNIDDNSKHVVTGAGVDAATILDGFTITAGNATDFDGGGMYLGTSNPILTHLIFTGNTATNHGGGLYNNYGSPTLTDVTFIGNTAINWNGGGMYSFYRSTPTLNDVTFTANAAVRGGGLYVYQSSAALTNVTFTDNTATYGGGLGAGYYGTPELTEVVFSGNQATYGGGIYNDNNSGGYLTRVTFSGNSAASGGAIHNTDHSGHSLSNVTFEGNIATSNGGGVYNYNSASTIDTTTFIGNTAILGAGIYNEFYSSSTLTNVTFSANTAGTHGGGMYNFNNSNPILTNVTFASNSAITSGGGVYNYDSSPEIMNSLFWDNSPDQVLNNGSSLPTITYSVIQGGCPAGATCSEIITDDPLLGILADNGGYTLTHALDADSPAIDSGNPAVETCPATDQRGITRPIDGDGVDGARCDIGAYEYAFLSLQISIAGNGSVSKDPDQTMYEYGETVTLTAISDPGWIFFGWSGDLTSQDNPVIPTMSDHTQLVATFVDDIKLIFLPMVVK